MYPVDASARAVIAPAVELSEVCPTQFEQLIEGHSALFKRVAATYEMNTAKQQELFQEICLAVWRALPGFKGKSSLKTYMLRVAHNCSVKHVAKEVKEGEHIVPEAEYEAAAPGDNSDHGLAHQQRSLKLMHHVRQLPLQQRQVFALLMEGLSYKEIGQINGISTQHTGVLIMRIKQHLTEVMADE